MRHWLGSAFKTATPPTLKLTANIEIERANKCRMLQLKTNLKFARSFKFFELFSFTETLKSHFNFKKSNKFKGTKTKATLTFTAKEK